MGIFGPLRVRSLFSAYILLMNDRPSFSINVYNLFAFSTNCHLRFLMLKLSLEMLLLKLSLEMMLLKLSLEMLAVAQIAA